MVTTIHDGYVVLATAAQQGQARPGL